MMAINKKYSSARAIEQASRSKGRNKRIRLPAPKIPRVDFGREQRRLFYAPYIVIRYADGDDGLRTPSNPLPDGTVFWESPDVWVQNGNGINQPQAGQDNWVYARVSNWGLREAIGVVVKFYWQNPCLAFVEDNTRLIGMAGFDPDSVIVISSGATATVKCPKPWNQLNPENGGHECLLAEAFIPGTSDGAAPLLAPMLSQEDHHIGQKNEQLITVGQGKPFHADLQAINAMGLAQSLMFEVQPLRSRSVHRLVAARKLALPETLSPPFAPLPLSFRWASDRATFIPANTLGARLLLSRTRREVDGTAIDRSAYAQITHTETFEPWETRTIQISGRIPTDARVGQTFGFRVLQRLGRIVVGGYTVNILVVNR